MPPPHQQNSSAADRTVPTRAKSGQVVRVTDKLETPSLDDRSYRVIRLPNQLEALLVHDAETDKASASLDVNVGNFSDEVEMPGMAHAVEHLLFMGTKKYPEENAYSQYLSSNSGSSNAYTASISTNYFFDVSGKPHDDGEASAENPSPLYGALDRFAQFFIQPLFLASTLDRELQAVDSENKKNLQSDQWRLHQLEKSLSSPDHPYCHFSTGNLDVLKNQPEARGIKVREKFIEFYEKHYSANRMKLVVLGREPLDVLEDWVVELFSDVKNKDLEPNRWSEATPFGPDQLGMQWFAKPVMDSRELNLFFPFLDEELLYEAQPSRYISHLIGHEGPGSIMAYIKSRGWANSLSAGAYPICPGSPGIFDCQIRLTEEGLKNYQEVIKVFFEYVSLLREGPPQEWIFQEQRGMAEVDFKFKQKTPASRFTSKVSSVMQRPLPREWLLSGHSRLRKFDPVLIQKGIDCLRPDNFRMSIVSRDFPGNWDKTEKWYGTEYKYEKIPNDFMRQLKAAYSVSSKERISNLHLPHKNQFIPTKLEVEKKEVKEPAIAPRMIRNDELARTWYKKDDTFWVPKANLIVSFKSPLIYASAETSVKARLFTDLVRDALEEYSYDADLAGIQYSVSLDTRGITAEVSGYNDKLPVLLEQVLITMRDLEIKSDRFGIIKERLSRSYRNSAFQQPYHQLYDYLAWLTSENDYVVEELAAELPNITVDSTRSFHKELLSQLHMEVYVHGNLYKEDALTLTDMIESTLKPRHLPRPQWPIFRSLVFPPGSNFVYEKTLQDPANVNHAIEMLLHIGDKADRLIRAKTLLLDQFIHEPAFDQLRTKEQLGYVVFSGYRGTLTTVGFRFIIQSEKSPQYLETRIETFLTNYAETLANMSEADFESNKRSLMVKRLEKLKNLDQETGRHWSQIYSEYYDFNFAREEAALIKELTKADMIEFFDRYINPKSPSRAKLAIHLVAQSKSDVSTGQISELVKTLNLDDELSRQAATDLQAKLTAAHHDEKQELEGMKAYLLKDLGVAEDKVDSAVAAWKKLSAAHRTNGLVGDNCKEPLSLNGTKPVLIKDVRDFKQGLAVTAGARPVMDLSEYEDLDAKLRNFDDLIPVHRAVTACSAPRLVPLSRPHNRFAIPELPTQLAFTTSSLKKRKVTRQTTRDQDSPNDLVLPSTEVDPEQPATSFSESLPSGLATPTYVRADSLPASSLPPRLQTNNYSQSFASDYADSTASSPAAASADLSVDNDRGDEIFSSEPTSAASLPSLAANGSHLSLASATRRAIMVADGDLPQRSSSPLKRRASSMEPEAGADAREDVDMISLPPEDGADAAASPQVPPEVPGETHTNGSSDLDKGTNGFPMIHGHPPIPEQIKTIQTLLRAFSEQQMQEGDIVYLVSRKWLEKALALGTATKQKAADQDPAELGPVDNADIIQAIVKDVNGDDAVRLVPGTGLDHFELFPKDAWDLLSTWYGVAEGQLPILRTAHNTAHDSTMPNIQVEFHPPVFTLHRLWSEVSPIPIEQSLKASNPPAPVVMCSTSHNLQSFLKRAKQRLDIPMDRKVRVWSIPSKVPSGESDSSQAKASLLSTPPDSPKIEDAGSRTNGAQNPWEGTLLAVDVFMKLEKNSGRDLLDFKDNTGNPNYNGHSTLAFYSLGMDQQLVLDESIDNTRHFVSTYNSKVASKDKGKQLPAKQHVVTSLASKASSIASGRSSPAPQGPMTRGRTKQKSGRTTGCVGLGNLGNTCYMNSALQCVRSVEELTKYFLVNEANSEINTDNPLGFSGHVAMAYSHLLHEIYRDPSPASVAPRQFKNVIGRYAPAFSGYGQQDSQEFLGFLLDGLQEDLSRIKKKPYIEKPDSTDEMINNPAAIREMADKVWDITKRRDDSVVADLFTGMYKSTLVCPVCEKISITFDPFTNLTLPLPIRSVWSSKIKYYPLNDTPIYIDCELDKASSMKSLKEFVATRVGTPVDRLFAGEEYKEKFFKYYEDYSSVSEEIHSNDTAAVHELEAVPTNLSFKQPKKQHYRSLLDPTDSDDVETPSWDTPAADRILVPVMHRLANQEPGFGGKRAQIRDLGSCVPPHFIVVSREEARSEDAIRRKVLEKVATFSSWAEFSAVEDSDAEVSTDADLVTAPASDADSAGDGKVVAKSVEGEEDMVDVAMKDAGESAKPQPLKSFVTKRPKWVDPKEWLSPQLQNLFELSYLHEAGSAIPTGWSSYSEDKDFPRLQTRAPAPPSDAQTPNSWSNSSENESDSEQLPESTVQAVARMAEESDDEITPAVKDIAIRPVSGRNGHKIAPVNRRGKMPRTSGRKNKRRAKQPHLSSQAQEQQQQQVYDSFDLQAPSSADGGPLIRLGEGLVVDWNLQAWEMVFGKEDENDSRGAPLFAPSKLETLPDPALEEKRKARNTRRKNGLTLGECLDEFEKEEILSENDTWYCPRCKEHRRASKKFDLWRTPDILIVHLKRFSSSGWRRDKLDTKVDFPVEGLDLTKRVLDKASGKEEIFDLIAVDDHWGGLGGGHYTAFAKNFIDHKWYEYNDSSVSKVSDPDRVVTQAAYLLFYRRRSTGPLGGPRFKAIVEKYEAGDDSSDEDEDMSESGEGQRLGTGSSLRGSSSALTGAEATLRQGGRGLANGASTSTLTATADQDCPPSYQQASAGFGDIGDEEPPVGAGILDFGQSSNVQKSIEDDEGIGGMADHHENSWPAQKWTFENLGGDDMGSSNEVQANSSETANDADSMIIGHDGADRDAEMGFDGGDDEDYGNTEVAEPAFGQEEPPLLDPFNQANMDEIRDQVWNSHAVGQDHASEKAVDIHISEDDQKMV